MAAARSPVRARTRARGVVAPARCAGKPNRFSDRSSPRPPVQPAAERVACCRTPARNAAALAAAFLAGVLQQATRSAAGWTGGRGDDLSENRLGLPAHLAGATTPRARVLARTGLRAAAIASVARGQPRDFDWLLDTGERFFECDRQVVAKIVSAVGTFASSATAEASSEKGVEDVGERHVGEVDPWSPARLHGGVAEHVVRPPPSWIGEHRVRLAGFLEPGGRDGVVRIAVGMRVHRDLAKRALQVLGRALPGHTQDFVVVAIGCQSYTYVLAVGVWKLGRLRQLHEGRPDD